MFFPPCNLRLCLFIILGPLFLRSSEAAQRRENGRGRQHQPGPWKCVVRAWPREKPQIPHRKKQKRRHRELNPEALTRATRVRVPVAEFWPMKAKPKPMSTCFEVAHTRGLRNHSRRCGFGCRTAKRKGQAIVGINRFCQMHQPGREHGTSMATMYSTTRPLMLC